MASVLCTALSDMDWEVEYRCSESLKSKSRLTGFYFLMTFLLMVTPSLFVSDKM